MTNLIKKCFDCDEWFRHDRHPWWAYYNGGNIPVMCPNCKHVYSGGYGRTLGVIGWLVMWIARFAELVDRIKCSISGHNYTTGIFETSGKITFCKDCLRIKR